MSFQSSLIYRELDDSWRRWASSFVLAIFGENTENLFRPLPGFIITSGAVIILITCLFMISLNVGMK